MNDQMAQYCITQAASTRAAAEGQRPGFLTARQEIEHSLEDLAQVWRKST